MVIKVYLPQNTGHSEKLIELRKTPEDNHHSLPPNVIKRVGRHCYMDDCLKSLPAEQKAVEHVGSLSTLLSRGGFKLTK